MVTDFKFNTQSTLECLVTVQFVFKIPVEITAMFNAGIQFD